LHRTAVTAEDGTRQNQEERPSAALTGSQLTAGPADQFDHVTRAFVRLPENALAGITIKMVLDMPLLTLWGGRSCEHHG
jgi:hypothetical protein